MNRLFTKMSYQLRQGGFTLVELVVVIAILAIISTIGMISYSSNAVSSRDATRKTDMGEMKVRLRWTKQKLGAFSLPANNFSLSNSGVVAAYQGTSDSITLDNGSSFRTDPRTNKAYLYSTMANRQGYQIAMTLESVNVNPVAYVDGDFLVLMPDVFPSLLLATAGSGNVEINNLVGTGSTNRKKFIVNNGTQNLPYDMTGTPTASAATFTGITAETGVSLPVLSEYTNCQTIYEAGKSMGPGNYSVLNSSGAVTSSGCVMSPPSY